MRRLVVVTSTLLAIGLQLVGCSGGDPVTMRDVVGKRLDVALSDVERAGFESSEDPTDEPTAESTEESTDESAVLTLKNSKDLAEVLKVPDYCSPRIVRFAGEFRGRMIKFQGSVSAKGGREYSVSPGDKGSLSATGPMFAVTGANNAANLALDDLVRVVATVDRYNVDQCLFFLDAVSVELR